MPTKKPKGRVAKRRAFYALNRRKALGRAMLQQIRAAMPIWPGADPKRQPLAWLEDELDWPGRGAHGAPREGEPEPQLGRHAI